MRRWLRWLCVLMVFSAAAVAPAPEVRADNEGINDGTADDAPGNPDDDRPECDDPSEQGAGGSGTDPVYLDTGEFYVTRRGLTTPEPVIPVRGDLVIDLRRSYRSNHAYNGALGYGWDFRFNRRLRQLDNGNLVLTSGTCRSSEYNFNGSGWDNPPGVFATLVQNPDGSYTQTFPSGLTHSFDPDGNLIEMRDRHGNRTAMDYTATKQAIQGQSEFFVDSATRVVALEYRLDRIRDPLDREIVFSYDPTSGRLESLTDWGGRTWSYVHDAFGNLTDVTSPPIADFPLGTTTSYLYSDPRFAHKITKIIPPNGQTTQTARVENVYDAEGRVEQQNLGNGAIVTIAYDPDNQTTTVIDGNGTNWIYVFQDGQITSVTVVTRGVRDPADEPVGTTYTTSFQFNAQKQRTRTVFPEGNEIERIYDSANPNVLAHGNLLELRRHPKPGMEPTIVTQFTYKTPYQQLGTVTDPRGNVTEYFYDASDNLQRIDFPTVPEGTPQELYTINAFGQLASVTDANGNTTQFVYDVNGYLDQITRAFGTALAATIEFDPDSLGRPTVVRDGESQATALVFNAWDRLERTTAPMPLLYETNFHYDESGNLERIERDSELPGDPDTTTFNYNVRDWLLDRTNERNEAVAFGYDANGNRNLIRDPELNDTTIVFDERNLPYQRTDAENRVVRFHYHANGNLSRVLDGEANETAYDYDDFDRLEKTTHTDATSEVRGYDAASNPTAWTTRSGDSFTLTYDALNRRRSRTTPADTTTFDYDRGGRPTGAANAAVTLAFGYNARNELETETTTLLGLPAFVVAHEYDLAGNRRKITYPNSTFFTYDYDELNRLRFVRDSLGTVLEERIYDELSRPTDRILSNGVTEALGYDRASRIDTIDYTGPGGSIEALVYTRDPTGAIDTRTDGLGLHLYGYDQTKQLTSVDYPATSPFEDVIFAYDNAGNRDLVTTSVVVDYVANTLNQYSSIDGVTQLYDQNGSLTDDGTNTYTFDAESRLASALVDDGFGGMISTSYAYDPFMRRVTRTVDGTTTVFLWSGDDAIGEYDATGARLRRYLYAGDFAPILVQDPDGMGGDSTYRIHTDHLDTPRWLTDDTGTAVWRADLAAFGRALVDEDPDGDLTDVAFHLRFPGQYEDPESGLHYNRFRYYDPGVGRYVSSDPIGQAGGLNTYVYSGGNPTLNIDPLGLFSVTVSFFVGKGGSVTVGVDDNGFFFTGRAGVGLEAGITVDPNGECPVQPEDFAEPVPEGSTFGGAGFFAGAGVNLGPLAADVEGTGGLGVADTEDGSLQGSEISDVDAGGSVAGERGLGLQGGGSMGVFVTIGGI